MKGSKKSILTIFFTIALVPILVFTVSAETYTTTFSLMDIDDLMVGTTNVYPSNSNITEYTQRPVVLIDVSADSPFVFGSDAWRQTVNVTKWTPVDTDTIYAGNWTWQAGYRLPELPSADSRFFVFTVVGRMSSTTYTQPIEDSSILINGISLQPSKIVKNNRGNYYTYIVDSLDVQNMMDGLRITFNFGDFEAPTTTSNIGYTVYLTYQFSDITVYSTLSAAAQHAQAIENLIQNDISPTLDNIENTMDQMNGKLDEILKEDPVINSQFNDQTDKMDQNATVISSLAAQASHSYVDKNKVVQALGNAVISDDAFDTVSFVFEPILRNNYVIIAMTLSCTLALGGYVIFGKRG